MVLERFRPGRGGTGRPDLTLALLAVILSLVGLIAIYSASWVIALERFDNLYYYLSRQAVALVAGLILMIICASLDYQIWKRLAPAGFLITLLLLTAVLTPLGTELGGARRWIDLGPVLFQPSELAKLAFIVYLAAWFEKRAELLSHWRHGFLPFLVATGVISALIILQPDIGTMMVLALTAMTMAFVAGAKAVHLLYAGFLGAVAAVTLVLVEPYRIQRLLTFLKPSELLGSAYHINQSLLAVGSGGLFGRGFGQSIQKHLYLPTPFTDSIFAIIAEELGFLRAGAILALLLWLAIRGYRIARGAPDDFSRLLATGITSWLIIQASINLGSMLGVLPLTGVPLPFISYGGSSIIFTLAGVGILLSISRHSVYERRA